MKLQKIFITCMLMLFCIISDKCIVEAVVPAIEYGKLYTVDADENEDRSLKYPLYVNTSGKVTMAFSFKEGQYSWTNVTLRIVDNAGNCLGEMKVGRDHKDLISSFNLISGNYDILFVSSGGSIHNSFKVEFKADFQSANETIQDSIENKHDSVTTPAIYPAMDSSISGFFAINDDTDVYQINLTSSGIYNITLVSTEIQSMDFSLIDKFGVKHYEEQKIGVGTNKYEIPLVKGTYLLTVKDNDVKKSTGIYTLTTKMSEVPKVKFSKVKNSSKKKMKVTWKRNSSVDGYQVEISTYSNFKKGVKKSNITNKATSNTVFNKLKVGKKYYTRVRTYSTTADNKKIYSKWSNVKNLKIKK